MDTVYPELFIPGEAVSQGEVRHVATGQCLDSHCGPDDLHKPLGVWPCHLQVGSLISLVSYRHFAGREPVLASQQNWGDQVGLLCAEVCQKHRVVRRDEECVDYGGGESVILYPCHGQRGNQWWQWEQDTGQLRHAVSRKVGISWDDPSFVLCGSAWRWRGTSCPWRSAGRWGRSSPGGCRTSTAPGYNSLRASDSCQSVNNLSSMTLTEYRCTQYNNTNAE